jgi:release factor glutamine methyltransferase
MAAVPDPRVEPVPRPSRDEVVGRLRLAGCVFAEDEARLLDEAAADGEELRRLVERRVAGEPLEPLLGWVEFGGLRLSVAPGVFVPRRRTQALAQEAARLAGRRVAPNVVDLCCGVGAIAAVICASSPRGRLGRVVAADLDPVAVELARTNLAPYGGEAYAGDLYDALPAELAGAVDVLTVNAPYVPTDEVSGMPREARDYEPGFALDGGFDGLEVHRRVAGGVRRWLAPGASMLIETSRVQVDAAVALLTAAGLVTRVLIDDELDATVVIGRSPVTGR